MPRINSAHASVADDAIEAAQDLVRALEHYSDLADDLPETLTQTRAWKNAICGVRDLVRGEITRRQNGLVAKKST